MLTEDDIASFHLGVITKANITRHLPENGIITLKRLPEIAMVAIHGFSPDVISMRKNLQIDRVVNPATNAVNRITMFTNADMSIGLGVKGVNLTVTKPDYVKNSN